MILFNTYLEMNHSIEFQPILARMYYNEKMLSIDSYPQPSSGTTNFLR